MDKEQVLKDITFEVEELKEVYSTREGQPLTIPERKAIYRPDLNQIVGIVSNNYVLIPHQQIMEVVFDSLESDKIDYNIEKLVLPFDGNKMFLHLRFPETHTIGKLGDNIQLEMVITNSFDGSISFGIELGAYRLVCRNGMMAWRKEFGIRRKHYIFSAQEVIKGFVFQLQRFEQELIPFFNRSVDREMSLEQGIAVISDLDMAKKYQQIAISAWRQDFANTGNSLWVFYNVITQTATHSIESYMVQRYVWVQAFQLLKDQLK